MKKLNIEYIFFKTPRFLQDYLNIERGNYQTTKL